MTYFLKPTKPARMKILIDNDTAWDTKTLRPFITRIAREEFPGDSPRSTRSRLVVKIRYGRGGASGGSGCSGHAHYNSNVSQVNVPNPKHSPTINIIDFCFVVAHELAHNRGVRHAQMLGHYRRGDYAIAHFAWALKLPQPSVKVYKRPTLDEKRAKELKVALATVAKHERRLKLAGTLLKKWRRKVRTIVKRMEGGRKVASKVEADRPDGGQDDPSGPVAED